MARTESTETSNTIFGIFRNDVDAASALEELQAVGVPLESVSATMRDPRAIETIENIDQPAAEGAARGLFGGGALGAVVGGLVGLASIAMPGVIPIIVAGPLAGVLGGALTGGAVGGIAGALTRLGAPEHDAKWYEEQLGHGAILLAVHHPAYSVRVTEIIRKHSGVSVGVPGVLAAGFAPEAVEEASPDDIPADKDSKPL
ncbi:MAG TPA: hypothetical protein VMP10_02380 [Chloroflexota bacterium]|nr:hypothetical protein [Chloroflexota bacterium]